MNYLTGALRFILIVISIPFFMFVAGVRFPKAEEAEYRKLVETWCRRLLAMLGVRVSYTGRPLRHRRREKKGTCCFQTIFPSWISFPSIP